MTTSTTAQARPDAAAGNGHAQPSWLPVQLDGIPEEMKAQPRWLNWQAQLRTTKQGSKWTKVPFQANLTKKAKSNDPKTWSTLAHAILGLRRGDRNGIGFVFAPDDGITGIDLDHCRDPKTGAIAPWAQEILTQFPGTYAEISPSGTGVKLFVRGTVPAGTKKGDIEIYPAGRYFTVTGHRYGDHPSALADCQDALTVLYDRVKAEGKETAPPDDDHDRETQAAPQGGDLPDDKILELARGAKNGAEFSALWGGTWEGAYPSQSEADLALCSILAFYSGPHPDRIDRLFRQSGLFREKWDEKHHGNGDTYGAATIKKAIEGRTEFYQPKRGKKKRRNATAAGEGRLSNAIVVTQGVDEPVTLPMPMTQIVSLVSERTAGELRRVDKSLFAHAAGAQLDWLASPPSLFGFLQTRCGIVEWRHGAGFVTKEEFFAELQRQAPNFEAVEILPHWPPIATHYYTCPIASPGDGRTLADLMSRYSFASDLDRELAISMFATGVWGGLSGCRPAWLITAQTGRGRGKSTLAQHFALLFEGAVDVNPGEDITIIKKRLLSKEAQFLRVGLLDNLKTMRFSWGEFEALLTSPEINGWQIYVGDSRRPNLFTWAITLNGASLSTDMAQRIVEIKLGEPIYSETWEEETRKFIDANRGKIIADCIEFLQRPAKAMQHHSRWATWEGAVLSRCDHPEDCLCLILDRRGAVDVEVEEGAIIEDFFAQKLTSLGYDTDRDDVFIFNDVAARWFNEATGDHKKVTGVTRALKQLHDEHRVSRIVQSRSGDRTGRGFRWIGQHADAADVTHYDLRARIASKLQEQQGPHRETEKSW
jgi:hypothetical protein